MTRKWFVLFTILAIAAIAVFVTDQVTQAQRPDRGERRDRPGGGRRGGDGAVGRRWHAWPRALCLDGGTITAVAEGPARSFGRDRAHLSRRG